MNKRPWLHVALLILAIALSMTFTPRPAHCQSTPPRARKNFPNYREPAREYQDVEFEGRKFIVEKQLLDENSAVAKKAIQRLQQNIDLALQILPRHSHEFVAKQQFWLMYGPKATGGGVDNGLAYFRPGSPKFDPRRDENWNSVVVVYHAENYVSLTDLWALKSVLHELAHAYHLEQWPEKEPDILSAYDTAMSQMLYRNVRDDKGKLSEAAYASVNQLEYFAELTCMHFAKCNYQPFNRLELKRYDPGGYEMIRKMWRIGDEYAEPQPRTWRLGPRGNVMEATFKSFSGGRVTLIDDKSRKRVISFQALSAIDQDYVKCWLGE